MHNLALVLEAQGDYTQAHPLYERALALCERVLGLEHPHTAICLYNLAEFLRRQDADDEARPLYERALAIRERVLGPDHPDTQSTQAALAVLNQHLRPGQA